jgi:hypothetical protein
MITVGVATAAMAETTIDAPVADEFSRLSSKTCFGIVSGEIAMPTASAANGVDQSTRKIEGFGLTYGFSNEIATKLGNPGLSLVARSTMGSKSFPQADIVFAVGGSQPGCRVIVLSEPDLALTDMVSNHLVKDGWTLITEMTATRGAIERRAYIRRDGAGQAYLINLMTILSPAPGSKMRLFTTTVKIPPNVRIPDGY